MRGINTPEIRGPEAAKGGICWAYVKSLLEDWKTLFDHFEVETYKGDKYGRWLADIRTPKTPGEDYWSDLALDLIGKGYAYKYDGTGPIPRFDPNDIYPMARK